MSDLENRLDEKIKSLYEILEKYNKLNGDTKYRYNWRVRAIEDQLDALEQLRDNKDNNWNECYEEDLRESKEG